MTTLETSPRRRTAPRQPDPGPHDLADYLTGRNGLDLVVEMAHDLRSPLSSILVLAETLAQGRSGAVTERQRRQLGLIHSAALCLCTTASDVLELARGDRLGDVEPVPFSLNSVLASVRDLVRPTAEEKGLQVRLTEPVVDRRKGHPRALSRVLLNLTTNALKFTERGHVDIGVRERGSVRVEFSVTDTGPGISAAAIRSLYHPFRRSSDDARYHFSGSGLGLAICRKLVGAMESELLLETEPGDGTRFFFELNLPKA